MTGWFERRRLAKEEARQRAIEADLAANDLIALNQPVKPRPVPQTPPAAPTPVQPTPKLTGSSPTPSPAAASTKAPETVATEDSSSTQPVRAEEACGQLLELRGAVAAAVIDTASASPIAARGPAEIDLDSYAAAAVEVSLAHRAALGEQRIVDAVITTDRYHLLMQPSARAEDGLLLYLVLDAEGGNLALARRQLSAVSVALVAS